MTRTYTFAELEAMQLFSLSQKLDPNKVGNKIIALAERIKAERAVIAMSKESKQ